MSAGRRLALPALGKAPVVFAGILGVGLPLGIAVGLGLLVRQGELSPAVLLMVQALIGLVVLAVVLPIWRREAALDGDRLRVKAAFYSRESPLADFDLAAARAVDLREHTELRPWLKTNGYALPGFQAGHFLLRDRRKAFCLVTDPARVLALPHRDGRVWLLSLEHPQPVLEIFRRTVAGG